MKTRKNMNDNYLPEESILTSYAEVLVKYALGGGLGIKKNDVVYLQFDAPAYPLAFKIFECIVKSGGHPLVRMNEERFQRILYDNAEDFQLDFFPKKYMKSLVRTIDHRMYILAEENPFLLKGVPAEKLVKGERGRELMRRWLFEKEDRGQLTWTIALYGTVGMACEAGLTSEEFWHQIMRACFLDKKDPIRVWKKVTAELEAVRDKLSKMPLDTLNITSKETDLTVKQGDFRQWLGGDGRNIPSFEIFTSPDWRGTNGRVFFDYPLYRYGNIIKDIRLEFKEGRIVRAEASKNEKLLKEIIKQRNADKIGEFSLTDTRFSRINTFMANTLYDENFGGRWGNMHLAVGSSYHEAYTGGLGKGVENMRKADWKALGFNESAEHTDIIATNDRIVRARLKNGVEKVIYQGGKFTV